MSGAEVLRHAATRMREQHGPEHKRHEMWDAIASLLENAAEDEDLLSEGGDLGPQHDTFLRRFAHNKAVFVARTYMEADR